MGKNCDANNVIATLQRYRPNPREGEQPPEWEWWSMWAYCLRSCDSYNIQYLHDVLTEWAKSLEMAAAKSRHESWCDWAISSVKKGAAPAHKFLKGPHPWANQDWSYKLDVDDPIVQGSPQHHLRSREAFWHPLWKTDDPMPVVELPTVSPEQVMALQWPTPEQFRKLVGTYADRTAVGVDFLHPKHYGMLCDEAILALVAIWRTMLLLGHVPLALQLILVALIPKEVGDRPIAIFASCIRLLTRWLRRTWGVQWAADHDDSMLFGKAGQTCLHCVWRHTLLNELAKAKGLAAYQLMLDITKAYENVQHTILGKAALSEGFNHVVLRFSLRLYSGPRAIAIGNVIGTVVRATRTIVAGCSLADLLLRCLTVPVLRPIRAQYPTVTFAVVADDIHVLGVGTEQRCMDEGPQVADKVMTAVECEARLPLSISKLVVMASTKQLEMHLTSKVDKLRNAAAIRTRNLGVDQTMRGKRLRKPIFAKRLREVKRRALKVHALRKAGAKVRGMVITNLWPASAYGMQIWGLSVTEEQGLRGAFKLAMGYSAQRSLTMDLLLDKLPDPAIQAAAMVVFWWAMCRWDALLPVKPLTLLWQWLCLLIRHATLA